MNPNRNFFIILAFVFGLIMINDSRAQVSIQDSTISTFILGINYAYQIPGGDMADRYGHNSTIGPSIMYKTDNNWLWTAEMNFIFGSDVKNAEQIISNITTDDDQLIGIDGVYSIYQPYERGFTLFGKVGKIFPAFNINPNSGIFFNVGLGYIQHKIRWDVEENTAPQLDGDYKKGYDRFTEGISFTEEVGLFYLGDQRLFNFKVSAEAVQSFTTMKRYNFDTMGGEDKNRLDLFFGLKISWMVPLYGRAPKKVYYF